MPKSSIPVDVMKPIKDVYSHFKERLNPTPQDEILELDWRSKEEREWDQARRDAWWNADRMQQRIENPNRDKEFYALPWSSKLERWDTSLPFTSQLPMHEKDMGKLFQVRYMPRGKRKLPPFELPSEKEKSPLEELGSSFSGARPNLDPLYKRERIGNGLYYHDKTYNRGAEEDTGWEENRRYIPIVEESEIENPLLTLRKAMTAATGKNYAYNPPEQYPDYEAPLSFLDLVTVDRRPYYGKDLSRYGGGRIAPSRYQAAAKMYAEAENDKDFIPAELIPYLYKTLGGEKTRTLLRRVRDQLRANRGRLQDEENEEDALSPEASRKALLRIREVFHHNPNAFGIGNHPLFYNGRMYLPPGYLTREDADKGEIAENDAGYKQYENLWRRHGMNLNTTAFLDTEERNLVLGKHRAHPLVALHELAHGRGGSWMDRFFLRQKMKQLKRWWNQNVRGIQQRPGYEGYTEDWDNVREELAATLKGAELGTTNGIFDPLGRGTNMGHIDSTTLFNRMLSPQSYGTDYALYRMNQMLDEEERKQTEPKGEEPSGLKDARKAKAGMIGYPGLPW